VLDPPHVEQVVRVRAAIERNAGELGGSSFQPIELVGMLREMQQDRLHTRRVVDLLGDEIPGTADFPVVQRGERLQRLEPRGDFRRHRGHELRIGLGLRDLLQEAGNALVLALGARLRLRLLRGAFVISFVGDEHGHRGAVIDERIEVLDLRRVGHRLVALVFRRLRRGRCRGFRRRGGTSRRRRGTLGELPLERGDAILVGLRRTIDGLPDGVVGLLLTLRERASGAGFTLANRRASRISTGIDWRHGHVRERRAGAFAEFGTIERVEVAAVDRVNRGGNGVRGGRLRGCSGRRSFHRNLCASPVRVSPDGSSHKTKAPVSRELVPSNTAPLRVALCVHSFSA
jgi:hypothetical protein